MTPLLSATLAYAAGLLLGLRAGDGLGLLTALAGACVLALLPARRRAWAAAAFLLAGAAVGSVRAADARTDCRTRIPDGAVVVVSGVPASLATEGVALAFVATTVRADSVACGAGVVRVRAQPSHAALLDSAARGQVGHMLLRGRWLVHEARNGWPRRAEYAGTLVVQAVAVNAASSVVATRAMRVRTAQQARLRALLPEQWGLAEALLLSQRGGLPAEVRERWVAAGLVHMLAISGMHVGLILAGLLGAGALLGLSRRTARRAALVLSAMYVLFLGAPAAALRALLQAVLLLGSLELQRPAEPFTALAAAALAILLVEPMYVLDPGFQLSFAGMIGLIGWRRPVAAALPGPKYVRDGLAAGIAASALTTPVAALHFGTAAWIGIVASLVATPVLAFAMAAIVGALALSPLLGTSRLLALPAEGSLRLLDLVAELAARVPGGHALVSPYTVLAVLASLAVAIIIRRRLSPPDTLPPPTHAPDTEHARWERRHRGRRLRNAAALCAALAVVAWAPLLLGAHDGRIEVHAIDVGQGDALAIRTPHGRWILVDAGPRTLSRDAGRERVVPWLLHHGVRRLDALILTHPDADHIGGAAAVLDVFPTSLIIDPGIAAVKDMFADLLNASRHRGQRWVAAREDMTFDVDGVTIALIYPPHALDGSEVANDFSVVFRLTFGRFAALFTGDAPAAAEMHLVKRHGTGLGATLLKVGHHGSRTSTSDEFLTAARPALALISSGRGNRYGHPAPDVVQRLERHRVRVLRTDELGNITVRAWRDGRTEVVAR